MSEGTWLFIVGVVPLVVALVLALYEVLRRSDLAVPRKVLWVALLLVVPPIGLGLYVIARPPRHRAAVGTTAPGTSRAEALVDLVESHVNGDIGDEQYTERLTEFRSPAT
jgi:hypothetical protein